jgi:hypothetical protein
MFQPQISPNSLSRNPLSSNEPNVSTFAHELAQAMLVYPKIPIKLAMKASRIDIATDPLPWTSPAIVNVPVSLKGSKAAR